MQPLEIEILLFCYVTIYLSLGLRYNTLRSINYATFMFSLTFSCWAFSFSTISFCSSVSCGTFSTILWIVKMRKNLFPNSLFESAQKEEKGNYCSAHASLWVIWFLSSRHNQFLYHGKSCFGRSNPNPVIDSMEPQRISNKFPDQVQGSNRSCPVFGIIGSQTDMFHEGTRTWTCTVNPWLGYEYTGI